MMFSVTHIDQAGHRRKARVTAGSVGNCMDQVDAAFGLARRVSCIRLTLKPVVHIVYPGGKAPKGVPCAR